jgi:lon-related putative ATP-dependent protease
MARRPDSSKAGKGGRRAASRPARSGAKRGATGTEKRREQPSKPASRKPSKASKPSKPSKPSKSSKLSKPSGTAPGASALPWDRLRWRCDPSALTFESTAEIKPIDRIVGQPRVNAALELGVGIFQHGFNVFAIGQSGTGKRSQVLRAFNDRASREKPGYDWCYVHSFEDGDKPKVLRLPPGQGPELRRDLERVVEDGFAALQTAFESEEYQVRREELTEDLRERQQQVLDEVREKGQLNDLASLRTPAGIVFVPAKDGEPLGSEELDALSEEDRERIHKQAEELQAELQKGLRQVPRWQRDLREQLREVGQEFAEIAVGSMFQELQQKYRELPEVGAFLDEVRKDVTTNAPRFLSRQGSDQGQQAANKVVQGAAGASLPTTVAEAAQYRYGVNVVVSHSPEGGAPVVYEDNPTYGNLVGRVDQVSRNGTLTSDFHLIRAGALHRSNGGYLLLEARKVLQQPFAWEALKRALRSQQVRIESPTELQSLFRPATIEPEPIPLEVKVALVGDPFLYYLLSSIDPELDELFKVVADFAETMNRDAEGELLYAGVVAHMAREHGLLPFSRDAVARLLERGARLAGDQRKLSVRLRELEDLVREANHWTIEQGVETVTAEHVDAALAAQIYRSDRMRESMLEQIERGRLLIDTSGAVIGQVNGLAVLRLGRFTFGRASRITARVGLGEGKVVDIEREVNLGGPLHSKGVLILAGFLLSRYGRDLPLSLQASLVFEQSYGGVDGDSASSAELYALLSAIAELPLRQSFAVTGSVNQLGEVQPIGGVNEKIEGFFDVCRLQGLTGEQGALIPASNAENLMLRPDVVEAARQGQFHVHPVTTIDQGIELLTGLPAGELQADGTYPEGSVNRRVHDALRTMTDRRLELMRRAGGAPQGARR